MEILVPEYCFQVKCSSKDKPGCGSSANGILVDRKHGWFIVNEHFISAGEEHIVVLPSTGRKHRLVVHKGLINKEADIALMSIEDPTVLPVVQLPNYGPPPTVRQQSLTIAGHQLSGQSCVEVELLRYPTNAWSVSNLRGDGYQQFIRCFVHGDIKTAGLSGSPYLDARGKLVGIHVLGKPSHTLSVPSFEIANLLKKARRPTVRALLRRIGQAIWN